MGYRQQLGWTCGPITALEMTAAHLHADEFCLALSTAAAIGQSTIANLPFLQGIDDHAAIMIKSKLLKTVAAVHKNLPVYRAKQNHTRRLEQLPPPPPPPPPLYPTAPDHPTDVLFPPLSCSEPPLPNIDGLGIDALQRRGNFTAIAARCEFQFTNTELLKLMFLGTMSMGLVDLVQQVFIVPASVFVPALFSVPFSALQVFVERSFGAADGKKILPCAVASVKVSIRRSHCIPFALNCPPLPP